MTSFNVLKNNMEELALTKMLEILPNVIDKSTKNKTSLVDSLLELTNAEIEFRAERAKKINITTSHFPYIKTFKDFDFLYQPSVNKEQIADLKSLRFHRNENKYYLYWLKRSRKNTSCYSHRN